MSSIYYRKFELWDCASTVKFHLPFHILLWTEFEKVELITRTLHQFEYLLPPSSAKLNFKWNNNKSLKERWSKCTVQKLNELLYMFLFISNSNMCQLQMTVRTEGLLWQQQDQKGAGLSNSTYTDPSSCRQFFVTAHGFWLHN
jgi:hypothetical protein